MKRRWAAAILAGAMLVSAPARADDVLVARGSRVRVTALGTLARPVTGTLRGMDEIELVIERGGESLRIPRAAVTRVDLSVARRHSVRNGAVIGAALGAALAYAGHTTCSPAPEHSGIGCLDFDRGPFARRFGAAGAVAGALLGSMMPKDVWKPVGAVRVGLTTPRDRGVGAQVALGW